MISVLSKTLKMEIIDMNFVDNSTNKLEIILGGAAKPERRFELTLLDFSVSLSFPMDFLSAKEFDAWLPIFEYELEQAYVMNVGLHVEKDLARYILKLKL